MDGIIIIGAVIVTIIIGIFLFRYLKKWSKYEKRKTIELFAKLTNDRKKAESLYKVYRVLVVVLIITLYIIFDVVTTGNFP